MIDTLPYKLGKYLVVTVWALSALLLTGCSQKSTSHSGKGRDAEHAKAASSVSNSRSDGPDFYYEQRIFDVDGSQEKYKFYASQCKGTTSKLLSSAQVAKLGLRKKQYWWIGNQRSAELDEGWNLAMSLVKGPQCVFGVKHTAKLTISYPMDGRIYTLNLIKHTGTLQHVPPFPSDFAPAEPPDWKNAKRLYGIQKIGHSNAAGQPCVIETGMLGANAAGTYCVWSAGKKWGYGVMGGSSTPRLWEKGPDGVKTMTADKFVIGHSCDQAVFDRKRRWCARSLGRTHLVGDSLLYAVNSKALSRGLAQAGIHFDTDSSIRKKSSDTQIKQMDKRLKSQPSLKVYIVRHSDNTGTLRHNVAFSQQRAASEMKAQAMYASGSGPAGNL